MILSFGKKKKLINRKQEKVNKFKYTIGVITHVDCIECLIILNGSIIILSLNKNSSYL